MPHWFTVAEANAILPQVEGRIGRLAEIRDVAAGRLRRARKRAQLNGESGRHESDVGADLRSRLEWFSERGIEVKGLSPPLIDFPARHGEEEILLCWTAGEDRVEFWHTREDGFAGRRPVSELDPES